MNLITVVFNVKVVKNIAALPLAVFKIHFSFDLMLLDVVYVSFCFTLNLIISERSLSGNVCIAMKASETIRLISDSTNSFIVSIRLIGVFRLNLIVIPVEMIFVNKKEQNNHVVQSKIVDNLELNHLLNLISEK